MFTEKIVYFKNAKSYDVMCNFEFVFSIIELTSWDQQEKSKLNALVESLAPIATFGFVITERNV